MIFLTIFIIYSAISLSYADRFTPCRLNDYRCIRAYLAANSDCDPQVFGTVPSTVTIVNRSFQVPFANQTYVDQYATMSNMQNCYVSAFFVNRESNRAVLGVSCPDIYIEANRNAVQRYPNAEFFVYSGKVKIQHSLMYLTVNLPHADDMDLCPEYVFPYYTATPDFHMDGTDEVTKKEVASGFNGLFNDVSIITKEEFPLFGQIIYKTFVDNVLCNFGCRI